MVRKPRFEEEKILAIARRSFSAEGPGVSTRALAAAIGMSQGALVQRFGSKRALFNLAMTPEPIDVLEVLGPDDRPLAETLAAMVDAIADRMPLLTVSRQAGCDHETLRSAQAALMIDELTEGLTLRLDDRDAADTLVLSALGAAMALLAGHSMKQIAPRLLGVARLVHVSTDRGKD